MVDRHDQIEGKEISSYKMKLFTNSQARVILKLIPNFGEEFPRYNVGYLSKVLNIHYSYVQEMLDFLYDKNIIECDGEDYFLTQDNLWKISETLNRQPMIILRNRIDAYDGTNDFNS